MTATAMPMPSTMKDIVSDGPGCLGRAAAEDCWPVLMLTGQNLPAAACLLSTRSMGGVDRVDARVRGSLEVQEIRVRVGKSSDDRVELSVGDLLVVILRVLHDEDQREGHCLHEGRERRQPRRSCIQQQGAYDDHQRRNAEDQREPRAATPLAHGVKPLARPCRATSLLHV